MLKRRELKVLTYLKCVHKQKSQNTNIGTVNMKDRHTKGIGRWTC